VNSPSTNPLRRELARSQAEAPHPDANLLTAFAEGTLTAHEREGVLEHLALCVACREVVNLAAGAVDVEPIPAPRIEPAAARPSIRRWLPWAATAAGVVVVSVAVLQHDFRETPKNELKSTASALQVQQNAKPSDETSGVTTEATNRVPSAAADKGKVTPVAPPPSSLGYASADNKAQTEFAAKAVAPSKEEVDAFASKVEAPGASGGAIVGGLARSREQQIEANSAKDVSAQGRNYTALQQAPAASANNQAANSNYAVSSNQAQLDSMRRDQAAASFGSNQMNSNQAAGAARAKAAPQRAAETVEVQAAAPAAQNDSGGLEAAPAPALSSAMLAKKSARPHWRINGSGQVQVSYGDGAWSRMLADESAKFAVISVIGGDVWAGGENARLYHSTDSGATWTPIPLPTKNGTAHTIVRIHFQTPQAGSVECDDGTAWISTDGGRTWK
jgi:hypothetical protein